MTKRIRIYTGLPKRKQRSLALVPFGKFLNPDLVDAKLGEKISFRSSWRKAEGILAGKTRIDTSSTICALLVKIIYGEDTTLADLQRAWTAFCVAQGLGEYAYSKTEVLLVWITEV